MRPAVNKVCIRNHCESGKICYGRRSSLKKPRWSVADERMTRTVSEIIPGDWGKAGPGWLARPLHDRAARLGNRRQDSPAPLAAFARRQRRETGAWRPGAMRETTPSRVK